MATAKVAKINNILRHPTIMRAVRKGVFTTGQVAMICSVAPRTVTQWHNKGQLDGYTLPGKGDRRFTLQSVVKFMKDNHFPPERIPSVDTPALCIGCDSTMVTELNDAFGLTVDSYETPLDCWGVADPKDYRCVVIDSVIGRNEAIKLAAHLSDVPEPSPFVVLILPEDETEIEEEYGSSSIIVRRPFAPHQLAVSIAGQVQEHEDALLRGIHTS